MQFQLCWWFTWQITILTLWAHHPSFSVSSPATYWRLFEFSAEESFLSAVINYTNSSTVHFKLSPAYVLYTAGRFALQHHHSQGSQPSGQTHRVTSITNKMVDMTEKVIQASQPIVWICFNVMDNNSWFNLKQNLCMWSRAFCTNKPKKMYAVNIY